MPDQRWLIVYADSLGPTKVGQGLSVLYDRDVADPYHIRKPRILVIAKADPQVGRIILSDCHYYCWRIGLGWFGVGRTDVLGAGLTQYLEEDGPSAVGFGYTVANHVFDEAMRIAMTDPYLELKSAQHRIERFNMPTANNPR